MGTQRRNFNRAARRYHLEQQRRALIEYITTKAQDERLVSDDQGQPVAVVTEEPSA